MAADSARLEHEQRRAAARVGTSAAAVTAFLAAISFGIAFATPPRSGPSCTFDVCVGYPFIDISAFFPRDYLWMLPATLLLPALLVLLSCIHYVARPSVRPFTLTAIVLAAISAAVIGTDYFIQLTVIQPSVLRGETDGLSLWSQYNPHGIFIALEAFGYLVMALALAASGVAFAGGGLERVVRWLFLGSGIVAVLALVVLAYAYGHNVEYRFEIAVISVSWTALIIGGALLTLVFRRIAIRYGAER